MKLPVCWHDRLWGGAVGGGGRRRGSTHRHGGSAAAPQQGVAWSIQRQRKRKAGGGLNTMVSGQLRSLGTISTPAYSQINKSTNQYEQDALAVYGRRAEQQCGVAHRTVPCLWSSQQVRRRAPSRPCLQHLFLFLEAREGLPRTRCHGHGGSTVSTRLRPSVSKPHCTQDNHQVRSALWRQQGTSPGGQKPFPKSCHKALGSNTSNAPTTTHTHRYTHTHTRTSGTHCQHTHTWLVSSSSKMTSLLYTASDRYCACARHFITFTPQHERERERREKQRTTIERGG